MKRTPTAATPPPAFAIDPTRVLARDVMRTDVLVLRVDDSIRSAAEQLEETHASGAPVVDAGGRLLGVLTLSDIARCEHVDDEGVVTHVVDEPEPDLATQAEGADGDESYPTDVQRDRVAGRARVADWMSPGVIEVGPEVTLAAVCRRMLDDDIHRVFVSDDGLLCGVVSATDVVRLLAAPPAEKAAPRPRR